MINLFLCIFYRDKNLNIVYFFKNPVKYLNKYKNKYKKYAMTFDLEFII